jgi:hypothetical protein
MKIVLIMLNQKVISQLMGQQNKFILTLNVHHQTSRQKLIINEKTHILSQNAETQSHYIHAFKINC